MLVSLGLNVLLIPKYGGIGAAVTIIIANCIGMGLSLIIRLTRKFAKAVVTNSFRPLLSSLCMVSVMYFFNLPLFIAVIFGVIFYVVILFILRGINFDDIQYMREVIGAKKDKDSKEENRI